MAKVLDFVELHLEDARYTLSVGQWAAFVCVVTRSLISAEAKLNLNLSLLIFRKSEVLRRYWMHLFCRRSRDTGYPASSAQIPACDFPAPGSSNILTRVARRSFTQAPDSLPVWSAAWVVETQSAPTASSALARSGYVFDFVDSTTCTTASQPPYKRPTSLCYCPPPESSCNDPALSGSGF